MLLWRRDKNLQTNTQCTCERQKSKLHKLFQKTLGFSGSVYEQRSASHFVFRYIKYVAGVTPRRRRMAEAQTSRSLCSTVKFSRGGEGQQGYEN